MKIITYIVILLFTFQLYGSKIGDFKKKLNEKKSSSSHKSKSSSSNNNDSDSNYYNSNGNYNNNYNDDDFWFYFWWYLLFGDLNNNNSNYSRYPYEKQDIGLYDSKSNKKFTAQFTTNYFHSNQLKGLDFNLKLAGTAVGIRVDLSTLWEKDDDGKNYNITFNNIFLNFYRIRESEVTMWWGLGAKAIDFDHTFAIDLGLELFLFKPVSFYLDYSVGFYEDFIIQELNTSLNIYSGRYYLKVGYHGHYIEGAFLSGPTIGVGAHF